MWGARTVSDFFDGKELTFHLFLCCLAFKGFYGYTLLNNKKTSKTEKSLTLVKQSPLFGTVPTTPHACTILCFEVSLDMYEFIV